MLYNVTQIKPVKGMISRVQVKVKPELFESNSITEETIYRDLARVMVSGITIEQLKKLIRFTTIDPRTSKVMSKIKNYKTDKHERDLLITLKQEQLVLYRAEVPF